MLSCAALLFNRDEVARGRAGRSRWAQYAQCLSVRRAASRTLIVMRRGESRERFYLEPSDSRARRARLYLREL